MLLQYVWILKTLDLAKEAYHKRLSIIWLNLYEMSRKGQTIGIESKLVGPSDWSGNRECLQMVCRDLFE